MSIQSNVQQQLARAVNLHQAGHLDMAEGIYQEILKRMPRNEHALGFLGRLCLEKGDMEQGAEYSRRALRINPNNPAPLNNLGYALLQLRQNDEALDCFDKLLNIQPNYAPGHYNRGKVLLNQERYEEAIESYRKGLTTRPNHADSYADMGFAYKCLRRFEEAMVCYRHALQINPQLAEVWNNLGNTFKELGRYKEGLIAYDNALLINPTFVEVHSNRVQILLDLGKDEEALIALDELSKYGAPDHFSYLLLRAETLQAMGCYEAANVCIDEAESLKPDSAIPHALRGGLHAELGNMVAAKREFEEVLRRDSSDVRGYSGLAQLGLVDADEQWFLSMQKEFSSRENQEVENQIALDFAMGKTLEALGRYDEAFSAYIEGNELFHQEHPVDRQGMRQKRAKDQAYFTKEFYKRCEEIEPKLPTYDEGRVPIFIVGMPRSGTTLIEQVLSSHPDFFGAGELNDQDDLLDQINFPPHGEVEWEGLLMELRARGREYLDKIWKYAPSASYISNKMPANFMNIGVLKLMLPNAKFIHAMRDPMDSCFSCYATRFKTGNYYSYSLIELGYYYRNYAECMKHWHSVLPERSILDLPYERMVADPEHEARCLLEYVGLPWDPDCLKFYENKRAVKTASFAQVRKPIYASSVARWQRFERHLGPLLELVSEYRRPA